MMILNNCLQAKWIWNFSEI